jgi:hypothetical protein
MLLEFSGQRLDWVRGQLAFGIAQHIETVFATNKHETCALAAGREAGPVGIRGDPELRRAICRSAARIHSINAVARAAAAANRKVSSNKDNKVPTYLKLQDLKRYWLATRLCFYQKLHVCLQNDGTRFGGGRGGKIGNDTSLLGTLGGYCAQLPPQAILLGS